MMSVIEYALDMNKNVEEVIKMCEKLGIKVNDENDYLDDDAIVELDNAFSDDSSTDSLEEEADEEIIKKIEEDDYYDEVLDTLIDKKAANYNSEPTPAKKKKINKRTLNKLKKLCIKIKKS